MEARVFYLVFFFIFWDTISDSVCWHVSVTVKVTFMFYIQRPPGNGFDFVLVVSTSLYQLGCRNTSNSHSSLFILFLVFLRAISCAVQGLWEMAWLLVWQPTVFSGLSEQLAIWRAEWCWERLGWHVGCICIAQEGPHSFGEITISSATYTLSIYIYTIHYPHVYRSDSGSTERG